MILTGRFSEFVSGFISTTNKEKEEQANWEFFLHKVYDETFNEFKEGIENNKKNQDMSGKTIETTVKNSLNILKGFNPKEGGDS